MSKRVRSEEPEISKRGWKHYFPEAGAPLDIDKWDLPVDHSPLEWWYYNCHVTGKTTGKKYSAFASFFRQAERDSRSEEETAALKPFNKFQLACTWAFVDVDKQIYEADSLLDPGSLNVLMKHLDPKYTGRKPAHAEGPLLELVKKGRLPRPDRLMKNAPTVSKTTLDLDLDGDCTVKKVAPVHPQKEGAAKCSYIVHLNNPSRGVTCDFTITPQVVAALHGENGVVNEMYYYYIPRCTVSGTITSDGVTEEVEGSGWYDREFGGSEDATGTDALDAWAWFSLQLDNDTEFSFFNVVDRANKIEKEKIGVLTTANGERKVAHDVMLTYSDMWTSLNTFVEYPMCWKFVVPSLNIELQVNNTFEHQEFMTVLVSGGGFYEGRVNVQGVVDGKPVTGTGFLERKNFVGYTDTSGLMKNVGRVVRKVLEQMYPLKSSQEYINKMCLGRHCTGRGVPAQVVCDTLFKPVRALIDRGGKAWRSLILISAISALSNGHHDSSKYLAISELLHVGSLIIDDIQDESTVRRGDKCVHLEFGVPTAINAGTGCYFMAPILSGIEEMKPEKGFKLYNLYFDVMRAGHAGQGLDINGLDYLMPEVVETGVTEPLFDALQAVHVYKTGGAAGTLCAMACVICEVSDEIQYAFGNFGTQLGLAFQIVDDALNLKGFEGDLKEVGEDIRDGKITYPVIKAMGRLSKPERQYIWGILQERTSDTGKIRSVIDKLNSVGAIDDCLSEARELVEAAWERLDPLIEDSLPKMFMRTFCNYLTERTI